MRAAFITEYGDPRDVVQVGEQPEPIVGPDSVLVSVRAASVNPVDWKIVSGGSRSRFPHHLPLIPGWDVAGVVEAVGPAITDYAPGDRVLAYAREDHVQYGTYAERVAVPHRTLAHLPDEVDFERAAAVPLAALTAEQLLDAIAVRQGDTVLVHAASGGVGTYATQLARMRGATVVGSASERNHDRLRARGVIPVSYGDPLEAQVREAAPGGVDAIVDLVGGEALAATPRLLAPEGRVASVLEPATVLELGGRYVFVHADSAMLERLIGYVASGDLEVDIAAAYPLERAAEALAANAEGHTRGKIVVTVG